MKKSLARKIFTSAIEESNVQHGAVAFEYKPNAIICTIKSVHNFSAPTVQDHGTIKELYNKIFSKAFALYENDDSGILNKIQQSLVVRRSTNMTVVCSFKVPIDEEIKKANASKLDVLGFVETAGALLPKQEKPNDWLTQ